MRAGKPARGLLYAFLCSVPALAQRDCPQPPAIQPLSQETNIFSDQQEVDLGDATAESLAQRVRVIDDDKLNSYLRALGERVVQYLPPNHMQFRFYLIELPEVNAFSIAGGRVYVARKMVALAQSDDELAGVLAHELGHIVTHQSAVFMTQRFREVLNVTQVGSRDDVFQKYHQFLENVARKPGRGATSEQKGQMAADQVALYAMARAGYAPHAYVDLWDRFQQTHGKTGSWFTDLFGSTKPSERRLREMLKNVSALPPGCADLPPGARSAEFSKWQTEVIAYSGSGHEEALPGLVFKQTLALPLRPDITYLRFSPDGKYILAQDEGGIHVVSRDPFAVAFYIPALDAYDAALTADSRSIVFHNHSLRVETWSIAEQKRTAVYELTWNKSCLQTALSPNASALACLDEDWGLSLIDVPSSTAITTRKSFCEPLANQFLRILVLMMAAAEGSKAEFIHMGFSPDAHYFLAGCPNTHFTYDLTAHHDASLPGSIKDITSGRFAFIGSDEIAGVDPFSQEKSPLLQFPSGRRIDHIPLSLALEHLGPPGHGDYLIEGPRHEYPIGILDLKANNIPVAVKQPAIDIYDGVMVHERISGELALNEFASKKLIAKLRLPEARLGPVQAAVVSPDFDWMAISNRTRGAVWDLPHNIRTTYLRSFHGAWYGDDQSFYLDFPKYQDIERSIGRVYPRTGDISPGYLVGKVDAVQHGPYLIVTIPRKVSLFRNPVDADVEARDVRSGKTVWSRHFAHDVPSITVASGGKGGSLVMVWPVSSPGGHEVLQKYPDLKSGSSNDDYICEVVDVVENTTVGKLLIKTNQGSFRVRQVWRDGDWILASVGENQVLAFSLTTGQEKARFFGLHPDVSAVAGLIALESDPHTISLYDLTTSKLRHKYTFPAAVSASGLSGDGTRLFVLTNSQTGYVLDVTVAE